MELITKILAEIFGSFIFLICYLKSFENPQPPLQALVIVVGLFVAFIIFGKISGGHFNGTISFMRYINNEINTMTLLFYIIAQIIGAILALIWWKYTNI